MWVLNKIGNDRTEPKVSAMGRTKSQHHGTYTYRKEEFEPFLRFLDTQSETRILRRSDRNLRIRYSRITLLDSPKSILSYCQAIG